MIEVTGTPTVILHIAVTNGLSSEVAIIDVLPGPTNVTVPLASTVATFVFDDFQRIFLLSAYSGVTVARS